jgi:D-amino-acid dehydrogenase
VLGHSPYKNLFLNTGHGSLGWTLTAGSAYVLADVIEGKDTEIALDGLTIERF